MSQTPRISDLVRDGHASPHEGALLLELRRDVASQRERKRKGVVASFVIAFGAFIFAFFARRHS